MKKIYCKCRLSLRLACLVAGLGMMSCSDDETKEGAAHRPDQPIELESFAPQTGPIATQVIIKGKNFGTRVEDIAVYFNEKRAAVISSTGERMLVLAPKLPGEECVIRVAVGENEARFDELFDYIVQTSVSTLVGGTQGASMPQGTVSLSSAQFSLTSDTGLAIDADKNLFAVFKAEGDNLRRFYMINEEAGSIKSVAETSILVNDMLLSYDYASNRVYWFNTNVGMDDYGFFDPTADFTRISEPNIKWDRELGYTAGMPSWGGRQSFAMNPGDNMFYFYTNEGTAARFDPKSGRGENLTTEAFKAAAGDVKGIVFDPRDRNIAYFSVKNQHCIYRHDIEAGTCEVWAGRRNTSGYLDGALEEAQFNNPCQMCADEDYIYVTDSENHCIRRITLATGYVSTLAGMPRQSGYANGPADIAQFYTPIGIVIDKDGILYVNDRDNYAIRRIATE